MDLDKYKGESLRGQGRAFAVNHQWLVCLIAFPVSKVLRSR